MFTQTAIDVLCRNHADDVKRLNQVLSTTGTGTLVPIPPHTYVGRVESRQPEVPCVLLLGINPMYSERPEHQKVNVHLPQRCLAAYQASGDVEDLRDLYEFQEGYFLREERNKRHFSKFGNWFGRHWFSEAYEHNGGGNAQNVLDKHVVEMDVLQYFSRTAQLTGIASSRRFVPTQHSSPIGVCWKRCCKLSSLSGFRFMGKRAGRSWRPC